MAVAIQSRRDDDDSGGAALPDLRNGQVFVQDNLWSTADEQYAVWVGADGTPYAGRRPRDGDGWETVDLAAIPGNPLAAPVADDTHNVLVVAVDAAGYVHVAGNMHDDTLRYVRSARPNDITTWVAATMPPPVTSVTYPRFVGLPDGTLQFWHREGMSGDGDLVLHTLGPGGPGDWSEGTVVLDGHVGDESPYPHHVAVGPRDGTIHLLFEWRGDGDPASTEDVGYLRSSDGGRTWQRADGDSVTLPATRESAGVVVDTQPGSGLVNDGGLTVDANGQPHALLTYDGGRHEHVWLDGDAWRVEAVDLGLAGRPALATVDGRVVAMASDGRGRLVVVGIASGERRVVSPVPAHWEATYDSQALATSGVLQTLIPDGDDPRVVIVELP